MGLGLLVFGPQSALFVSISTVQQSGPGLDVWRTQAATQQVDRRLVYSLDA